MEVQPLQRTHFRYRLKATGLLAERSYHHRHARGRPPRVNRGRYESMRRLEQQPSSDQSNFMGHGKNSAVLLDAHAGAAVMNFLHSASGKVLCAGVRASVSVILVEDNPFQLQHYLDNNPHDSAPGASESS